MKRTVYSKFRDDSIVYNHYKYENISLDFIPPQTHNVFEMIFVKEGNLVYLIEGKSYKVKRNSLILTRPGEMHNINLKDFNIYDRYDVFFEEKSILPSIYKKLPEEMIVINLNEYPVIPELFNKMDFYSTRFSGNELNNILTHLIEEIIYNITYITQQFPESRCNGTYTASPMIAEAVDYIETHLDTDLSLDAISKELGISKIYLHQLFDRHMQISPKKYIASKRLVLAQKAIKAGEKPTDVYLKFGFNDYSAFYRSYKKYFGYSPSQELRHKAIREIEF